MQRMVKYRVIRTCHWNYGYWDEGRVVEFPEGTDGKGEAFPIPNAHFQRLDEDGKDVPVTPVLKPAPGSTFSDMNKELETPITTGMMHERKKPGPKPKVKVAA